MNCERIEELISRYLEGDVSGDEERMVDSHLASCERCRESLETFKALEKSLGELKGAVPPWEAAEARFVRSFGFEERRSFVAFVFNAPFLAGLSFIAFGIVFFLRSSAISLGLQYLIERFAVSLGAFEQISSRWFEAFAGVNLAILISIYGLVIIAVFGGTWFVALRFGRR